MSEWAERASGASGGRPAISAAGLGFERTPDGWRKVVGGREFTFRQVRERADFEQCERLQREVFGVDDVDLASFSLLVVIPKTGGDVIGAYADGRMVGYIQGYGGYVNRRPRLVSDLMAVQPAYRGGLGYALKTLQAALALENGFPEMVWTVDPLRAANARLNVERLGAHAHEYVRDLYGSYAGGLYGELPTDRIIMTWPIAAAHVARRLLGGYQPLAPDAVATLPDWQPGHPGPARLAIPADIDALLASDPAGALAWRLRVREALEATFAQGLAITGFAGQRGARVGYYVLAEYASEQVGE